MVYFINVLQHHGVDGQKWGIKHGPPYPIDRTKSLTIKKGSKFGHVTNKKRMKLDNRGVYTFDPSDEHDADIYKGAYAMGLKVKKLFAPVYEQRFENIEDLKMPTHKEKVDAFVETISDNASKKMRNGQTLEQYLDNYVSRVQNKLMWSQIYNPDYYNDHKDLFISMLNDGKKWIEKRDKESGYKLFMGNFAIRDDMKGVSDNFINKLVQKGYNAMIDDLDAGRYNDAHLPIYIFNGKKSLRKDETRKMKLGEIVETIGRLKTRLGKDPDYS